MASARRQSTARLAGSLLAALAVGLSPVARASSPLAAPNDPGFEFQWGLEAIAAPAAWDASRGDGVTIAIVDSGIDLAHEDLTEKVVASASCIGSGGAATGCVQAPTAAQDDDGHGTHVAGIAAATADNGRGVAGVAPGAQIVAVRVLRHECDLLGCTASGATEDVEAGIRWAVDHGADVVNLSLGGDLQPLLGPSFTAAVDYAWDHGVIPVVAAGNSTLLQSGFSNEPALVVAATNRDGSEASYSAGVGTAQWGITAPGGEAETNEKNCGDEGQELPQGILSTYWNPKWPPPVYACLAGTSMAAPHVSGAAAVLLAAGLSPQQTVERLLTTAKDLGSPGRDSTYGAGLLDMEAATAGLTSPPPPTGSTETSTSDTTATSGTDATQPASTSAPAAPSTAPAAGPSVPPSTDPSFDDSAVAQFPVPAGPADDLPALPVAVAVLMVALTGASTFWWAFHQAGWARRTPG